MQNKKAVFFLLLLLISTALSTLLYHKFLKPDSKLDTSSTENAVILNLIKNHQTCIIQAGIKLDLTSLPSPDQAMVHRLNSLSGLPKALSEVLEVGDLIVGNTFLSSGDKIGEEGFLIVQRPSSGLVRTIPYIISPIVSCY